MEPTAPGNLAATYAAIAERAGGRAAVRVESAAQEPLEVLMAWREEVLRDVFELAPGEDLSAIMEANRRHYERGLSDGSLVVCFARPSGEGDEEGGGAAEPVATGALCLQRELPSPDNPTGRCGYLMNIYTRPAWRRRGIARAVVAWLCAEALGRGVSKVYLEATPAAMPLYRSLGFEDMRDYLKLAPAPGPEAIA